MATVTAPAGIAASPDRDVTDDLNAWLASLPEGSTAQLAAGATYRIDRPLKILRKVGLVLDGNGALLQRMTPTPPEYQLGNVANPTRQWNMHLLIEQSTQITVRNLHVAGLNTVCTVDPASPRGKLAFEPEKFGDRYYAINEGEAGVTVRESDDVWLEGVHTDGTFGDGFCLGTEYGRPCRRLTMLHCSADRNGRQGVAVVSVENGLFDDVKILHSWSTGFDLEPNGKFATVRNIEIRNCWINAYGIAFAVTGHAQAVARADNLYIHHNTVRGTNTSWPWLNGSIGAAQGPRRNWVVADNTVQMPSYGMTVGAVTDATVRGNVFPMLAPRGVPTYAAVRTNLAHGAVTVTGNDMERALAVVGDDGSSDAVVLACGNRTTAGGVFDQPRPC